LDRSTGQMAGLAPIRDGLSTVSAFPAELALMVLDYLLLPNMSAELVESIELAEMSAELFD
jgi:hypothetical protein